jgi:aryl-alcohol dehydrogenase-like predicted oxidoreductase
MATKLARSLGRSGIEISALGMGCWAIGGPFGRVIIRSAEARWITTNPSAPFMPPSP